MFFNPITITEGSNPSFPSLMVAILIGMKSIGWKLECIKSLWQYFIKNCEKTKLKKYRIVG